MNGPLLSVRNLGVTYSSEHRRVRALDRVDIELLAGDALGLVGESGSGKTTLGLALMRLLPEHCARIDSGNIHFAGIDIMSASPRQLRQLRGARMSMVFQEPMTALNPVYKVGSQIAEGLLIHRHISHRDANARALEMLSLVGMGDARRRFDSYPHELSGGMRQRVLLAMALICRPDLLIADEPATALDATTQSQVIDLIGSLRQQFGTAMLLISHDLGLVAESVSRVAVMLSGHVVELSQTREMFSSPAHPYTQALIACQPASPFSKRSSGPLPVIDGTAPVQTQAPTGCVFASRCRLVQPRCTAQVPELRDIGGDRWVRCVRAGE